MLCDYDHQEFADCTIRAMSTTEVWSLDASAIWNLTLLVTNGAASDEEVSLFKSIVLARAIPAESFKRTLRGASRCTMEMPVRYEHPEHGTTICFDVLLCADEDHTEEGSVGYIVRQDGWRCQCQGWGGDRTVEKFTLWQSPPWKLSGARRRNAQRTRRRVERLHRMQQESEGGMAALPES